MMMKCLPQQSYSVTGFLETLQKPETEPTKSQTKIQYWDILLHVMLLHWFFWRFIPLLYELLHLRDHVIRICSVCFTPFLVILLKNLYNNCKSVVWRKCKAKNPKWIGYEWPLYHISWYRYLWFPLKLALFFCFCFVFDEFIFIYTFYFVELLFCSWVIVYYCIYILYILKYDIVTIELSLPSFV